VAALYLRLALQFLAFYWAYTVTRPDSTRPDSLQTKS
jgi:uncharacterized membrane protein